MHKHYASLNNSDRYLRHVARAASSVASWTTMTTPQETLGLVDNYHAQYSCHYRVIR